MRTTTLEASSVAADFVGFEPDELAMQPGQQRRRPKVENQCSRSRYRRSRLATALALHQAGHDVSVFEAVEKLQPLGVGINLLPQAAHVLGKLRVLEPLLDQGVATKELSYFNVHGQRIWTEPRGLFAGFDAPQISISRGTLQMTLLEFVLQRDLCYGIKVCCYRPSPIIFRPRRTSGHRNVCHGRRLHAARDLRSVDLR